MMIRMIPFSHKIFIIFSSLATWTSIVSKYHAGHFNEMEKGATVQVNSTLLIAAYCDTL